MNREEALALREKTRALVSGLVELAVVAHGRGVLGARPALEWGRDEALPQLERIDVLRPSGRKQALAIRAQARRRRAELQRELANHRAAAK